MSIQNKISGRDRNLNCKDDTQACHVCYVSCGNVQLSNGTREVRGQEHAIEHSDNRRLSDHALMHDCKSLAGSLLARHNPTILQCQVLVPGANAHLIRHAPEVVAMVVLPMMLSAVVLLLAVVVLTVVLALTTTPIVTVVFWVAHRTQTSHHK